ncbi:MAG: M48 family metalloprotease [Ruminococcus flavefaciens]|nr:M48 family metalloprotease [Ruminococcus flavefaciens]
MENKGGFFKSNWVYLIWFALYFTIAVITLYSLTGSIAGSIILSAVLYGACISVALSPVGEVIVRFLEGAKPIQTQQDKDYLLPIFEEVYEEAKKFSPNINKDIQLYVTDSMAVNAFAVGRKTIAVTRGAINAFSPDELKGILSHELGHMANGDTKALLISLVGNGFFSLIIFVLRLFMKLIQGITLLFDDENVPMAVIAFFVFIFRLIVDFSIFAFIFVDDVILALNSRYSEYLADEYAHLIGYGEDLKSALYIISQISMPAKTTLTERLKASHPYTSARIERLEKLEMQSAC